jgi:ATP diphosphatase
MTQLKHTEALLEIMARLRDKQNGCPWDIEQNFASIAPYTIEEAYEVADAISRGSISDLREELGDLLLQVVFHSQMASEAGHFTFEEVAAGIAEKMRRRHPHVFGDAEINSADAQTEHWETIKQQEREKKSATNARASNPSILADVPRALPALMRAEKLQKRAARVGFDWEDVAQVIEKIEEELSECKEALARGNKEDFAEEIGDLLFAAVNLARFEKVDAEEALRQCNAKFTRRFQHVEAALAAQGKSLSNASLAEMEHFWNDAKRCERAA